MNTITAKFKYLYDRLPEEDRQTLDRELAKLCPENDTKITIRAGWGHFKDDQKVQTGISLMIESFSKNTVGYKATEIFEKICLKLTTTDLKEINEAFDVIIQYQPESLSLNYIPAMQIDNDKIAFSFDFEYYSSAIFVA